METLNFSYLIYLIIILIILLGTFLLSNKKNLNKNIQNLAIWGLIFFALLVTYYLWNELKFSMEKERYNYVIENDNSILINKSYDGHFYLPLSINNKEIIFLVDTGATKSLLSKNDYKLFKNNEINFTTEKILETANGKIIALETTFDKVKLFNNILGDVTFLVVRNDFEGPNISLLGLDLLDNKFNYQITNNYLKLQIIGS
jgi:clan AA aspartic protease, TIGR02281 family